MHWSFLVETCAMVMQGCPFSCHNFKMSVCFQIHFIRRVLAQFYMTNSVCFSYSMYRVCPRSRWLIYSPCPALFLSPPGLSLPPPLCPHRLSYPLFTLLVSCRASSARRLVPLRILETILTCNDARLLGTFNLSSDHLSFFLSLGIRFFSFYKPSSPYEWARVSGVLLRHAWSPRPERGAL